MGYEKGGLRLLRQGVQVIVLCALLLLPGVSAAAEPQWLELSGDHFMVYYLDDVEGARGVLRHAEGYYSGLTRKLGIATALASEHLSFWLWENRCTIYLYPDKESYHAGTDAPGWSGGYANAANRSMVSFLGSDAFIYSTLPHEIAHLLFREFVGVDNGEVPRWLHEGVAEFAEDGEGRGSVEAMAKLAARSGYLSFVEMNALTPDGSIDAGTAKLYYTQAASIIHFFLEEYGSGRFLIFLSHLRDGYPFLRSLGAATYGRLDSFEAFEGEWLRYLAKNSPEVVDAEEVAQGGEGEGGSEVVENKARLGLYLPRELLPEPYNVDDGVPTVVCYFSIYLKEGAELLRDFLRLHEEYGHRADFLVVSLDASVSKRVHSYLRRKDIEFPFPLLLDRRRIFSGRTGVSKMPTLIVYDSLGDEYYRIEGHHPKAWREVFSGL